VSMVSQVFRCLLRAADWAENTAFRASYLIAAPALLSFSLARAEDNQLSYSDLLSLASRFRTADRPTQDQTNRHQLKWSNRVARIARLYSLHRVLEAGCGQGIAAHHLQRLGFQVYATDIREILDAHVRQSRLGFVTSDVCGSLPYRENEFDLVFSINSFEHFAAPEDALDEMLRVTKPGGLIYLVFGPLYFSPWGLHADRRLGMPYPQILFSESTIQRFVDEKQAQLASSYSEGSDKTRIGPYLNRYSVERYRNLVSERRHLIRVLSMIERTNLDGLAMIVRHSGIFRSRVASFANLTVSGIKLLAMKRST
jgi:SAM-dependent methyltransferase